jgi:hypothetical protein
VFLEDSRQFASQKNLFPASCPDDLSYRPDAHQTKASTVQTTWIFVRTFLCVEKLWTALACIRPDDSQCSIKLKDFFPKHRYGKITATVRTMWIFRTSALIHKASIAIQIQTSGCQSSWYRCACIKYGNCVHQINRPDDHPPSLDARSLYMEITCSERATVRTTGQHRPDAALKQERFLAKFLKFWSHSCPSRRPMTTVRTGPSFIKLDAHLNC